MSHELITLHPSEIKVKEGLTRIRTEYGDIDDLAESIKAHGQIQPIVINRSYELLAGGRRLAACIKANVSVLCLFRDTIDALEFRVIELEENLKRKELTFVENAFLTREIDRLKKAIFGKKQSGRAARSGGWGNDDTAKLLNKSTGSISNALNLADALDVFPQLAEAKNENDARKMLAKIEEGLILEEMKKRHIERPNGNWIAAQNHYIVQDALTGLAEVASGTADFAEVDTPYGVDLNKNKKTKAGDGLTTTEKYIEWEGETFFENMQLVASETYRILKPDSWAVVWYGQEHYSRVRGILESVGFILDKIPAVWYKGKGMAQTNQPELYLARSYEVFFICRKGTPPLRQRGRVNVFDYQSVHASARIHPTEKPLELLDELIVTFCYPKSRVLVPFLGSGNTLRAVYKNECSGFGFDLNEDLKIKFLARVADDIKAGLYGKE